MRPINLPRFVIWKEYDDMDKISPNSSNGIMIIIIDTSENHSVWSVITWPDVDIKLFWGDNVSKDLPCPTNRYKSIILRLRKREITQINLSWHHMNNF